jgi:hypothetical protein
MKTNEIFGREDFEKCSPVLAVFAKGVAAMLMAVKTKRQSITMWALLVWAYKRHMVRYEVDRAAGSTGTGALLDDFLRRRSCYGVERGCINGAGTTAHDDAHVVHALVHSEKLGDARGLSRRERDLLIVTAEAGVPPDWNPNIAPYRFVPDRKAGNGEIIRIWSRGHAVGCRIKPVGVPPDEAEMIRRKARQTYDLWWRSLHRLRSAMWMENRLTLWKVTKTGAERQPWSVAY